MGKYGTKTTIQNSVTFITLGLLCIRRRIIGIRVLLKNKTRFVTGFKSNYGIKDSFNAANGINSYLTIGGARESIEQCAMSAPFSLSVRQVLLIIVDRFKSYCRCEALHTCIDND